MFLNSYDWSKSLNTKKHPLKWSLYTFYFLHRLFVGLGILCVKVIHSYVGKEYCAIKKETASRLTRIIT